VLELGKVGMRPKVKHEITKFRSDSGYNRIAILDDDKDVNTTFRTILESNLISKSELAFKFKVYTSNSPE
jgi:hypothetical protein